MEKQYQFRFIKGTTWGISINLIADDIPYAQADKEIKATDQIYLQFELSFKIHQNEVDFIVKAILKLREEIQERLSDQKIIIKITSIEFDQTDYQPEGLYVAMLGWISKRYDIPMPIVNVAYNKELKRYIFDID